MQATFTSQDGKELLRELAGRLNAVGVAGGIHVVGGAAIALLNSDRRATQDIDALLLPDAPVRDIAAQIGRERGLPSDWINEEAKAYVPPVGLEDWHEVFREGEMVVYVGSLQMLLAMKVYANKARRDTPDIEFLLDQCQITSLEQVQEIYERYHAQDVITDSAAARIRAWLERRGA